MKAWLKKIQIIFCCLLIWVILSPLIFIIFLCLTSLFIWRKGVDLFVHINHPDWIAVRARDSMFPPILYKYADQERSSGNIAVIGRDIDPDTICIQTMRQTFYNKVLKAPGDIFWKLKCVPKKCAGYYYWAPIPVNLYDLDKYVHKVDMDLNETDFDDFIGNSWIPSSFEGRSPWEILVVVGDEGKRASICLRVNHVIGGAIVLRNILEALDDDKDFVSGTPTPELAVKPISIARIAFICDCITLPWTLLHMAEVAGKKDKLAVDKICEKQVIGRFSLKTQTVKNVARHFKCPFRTVLAHVTGSAIRRFELENCSETDLPENTQLIVNLPWVYSPVAPTEPLNNKATAVYIKFPLKDLDPIQRLLTTKQRLKKAVENRTDRFSYYSRQLSYILPAFIILKMSSSVGISNGSSDLPATIANEQLKFFNVKTPNVYALTGFYGLKMGCFTCFATLGSTVQAVIQVNSNRITRTDDAQRMCEYAQQELESLHNYVQSQPEKSATIQVD